MTLTQFVQAVAAMRQAQKKKAENNSTKWITQTIRTERLVDTIIDEFFKEQTKNLPKEGSVFPPN